jgi:NAD(P)-dependent dehydrogenase (short-subunit alcohol dehydrogenase family)
MNEETARTSSEESRKYANNKEYQTTIFKMNVQDAKSVQDIVDFVVGEYGRLDYSVNGAGGRINTSTG